MIVRLYNWSVTQHLGPYQAPELAITVLSGKVYGHPYFNDGQFINTSCIQRFYKEEGAYFAQTLNTTYQLLEPSETFLKFLSENSEVGLEGYFTQKEGSDDV